MTNGRDNAGPRAKGARVILDFLTVVGLALPVPACGGGQAPVCANAGCGPPPMCGAGCQATCGCCPCAAGTRQGDLICTDQGCYAPAPPVDGGSDAGWTPPAICALPFDVGPCDAAIPVYAAVGGVCVPRVYGGCQGNENRFTTLEECMAACEGRPDPNGCPDGRSARQICLACGAAGGCAKQAQVCALACDADAGASVCAPPLPICYAGVCQDSFCE